MNIKIIKGSKLPKKLVKELDKIWYEEFTNPPMRNYNNHIFFIGYKGKKIMSIGRLEHIRINYCNKRYGILGIGSIVSVTKRKGYGKILMQSIIEYLKNKNKTGVGFCNRKNSLFYKKCGLKIGRGLVKRFYFKAKTKKQQEWLKEFYKDCHDVIYLELKEKLISSILKNKSRVLIAHTW